MIFKTRTTLSSASTLLLVALLCCFIPASMLLGQNPVTLNFAEIVHGGSSAPYSTTLQLFNASSQDTTATINLYQDNGTPFNVGLKDGQSGIPLTATSSGVFNVSIPARGLRVLITSGIQEAQSGWLQVTTPSSSLNGNVFFQQVDSAGNLISQAGVPASLLSSAFSGFLEKSATVNTGLALANPSPTASAIVTVQLITSSGIASGSSTVTLAPLQHIAQFIDEFPAFSGITDWVGTIAISSSINVVGTFLRQDRGQLTTVPIFAGTALSPTIINITPVSGAAYTTVTITGTNFDAATPGNTTVTFNGVTANIISITSSTIVTTVPKGLPVTIVPVVVRANGGNSNAVNFTVYDGFPFPVITSLDPPSALVGSASATITIHGRNFAASSEAPFVRFGSAKPAMQVINSTQATMTLTSDLLGVVAGYQVNFVNPGNTLVGENASNTVQFLVSNQVSTQAPVITGINPTSGRVNARVTITGSNFDPINANNNIVKFNGVVVTQVISVSGTQIVVNVPVGASSGPVTVTSNGLVSNSVLFSVDQIPARQVVGVQRSPAKVAYDPVLNQALVTNADSNSVSFVDVATATLIKNVQVGGQNPFGIAIYGRLAAVANFAAPVYNMRMVTLLNLDTQSFQSTINVNALGAAPFNLAIDPASGSAILTDNSLHLGVLNLVTQQTTQYFIAYPYDVAVYNPNSNIEWAVCTDFLENRLNIFDLKTNTQTSYVNVGRVPQGVAINPSTGIAVVVNSLDNNVSLVDLNTQTVVGTVNVGLRPNFVAIDVSRNRAVVTNNGEGTITVIDLATKSVIATLISGGNNPTGVAISESAGVAIVANANSDNVGIIALP